MYKCSKCNLEVIVLSNGSTIRACTCKVNSLRLPITKFEKFLALFGKKYYIEKNASILMDINAEAKGRSQFKQN